MAANVTVTTAATQIVAPGIYQNITLQNNSGQNVYLSWDGTPAAVATGQFFAAGATKILEGQCFNRGVTGIVSATTSEVRVQVL